MGRPLPRRSATRRATDMTPLSTRSTSTSCACSKPRPCTSSARWSPNCSARCCCSPRARTPSCCFDWRRRLSPSPLPFPVMHVDTGHNFDEVIEFRDRRVVGYGHKLIVASVQESIDSGRVPDPGPGASRNRATDPHPAGCAGGRRLRRGVRRRPPRRGTRPRQGTHPELPRRVRPVGSAGAAPRTVVAVQRPDQEGRTGPGLPAEQLDRTGRLALHRAGKP